MLGNDGRPWHKQNGNSDVVFHSERRDYPVIQGFKGKLQKAKIWACPLWGSTPRPSIGHTVLNTQYLFGKEILRRKISVVYGVPAMAPWSMNPTSIHEGTGSIPGLAQWPGSGIAMNCGVGCKCGLDPALPWLWHRWAAAVPIQPLAWELLYAVGAALKRQKTKKKPLSNFEKIPI